MVLLTILFHNDGKVGEGRRKKVKQKSEDGGDERSDAEVAEDGCDKTEGKLDGYDLQSSGD